MKLYTDESQTAKLIELGFEPKQVPATCGWADDENYSISELLSFLPDDGVTAKRLEFDGFHWFVDWDSFDKIRQTMAVELVDALYDMMVILREEEAI